MSVNFEWDTNKAETNENKHKVSFEEATTVFGDPLSLTIPDPLHSLPEDERFITIGMSYRQKLLIVVHCDKGNVVRIISARKATKPEQNKYEE